MDVYGNEPASCVRLLPAGFGMSKHGSLVRQVVRKWERRECEDLEATMEEARRLCGFGGAPVIVGVRTWKGADELRDGASNAVLGTAPPSSANGAPPTVPSCLDSSRD